MVAIDGVVACVVAAIVVGGFVEGGSIHMYDNLNPFREI